MTVVDVGQEVPHVLTHGHILRLVQVRHLLHDLGDELLEGVADDLGLDALLGAHPGGLSEVVGVAHRAEVRHSSRGEGFLLCKRKLRKC